MTKTIKDNDDGARVFADGRSITIGKGRILWGTATQTSRNMVYEEGWVLPGGQRTKNYDVAQAYASWIDAQCRVWGR
jgi:hypothetical protein